MSGWEGETANCEDCTHYGVDVAPLTGDTSLYAPWEGHVVGYDDCDDCPEGEGNTRDESDPFLRQYNYGYGATVVVEYAYEDISSADLQRLRDDGIDLQPGESLYLMATHLDREATEPEAGAAVSAGGVVATMDNSGNSTGLHAHVEVAVNASGLELDADSNLLDYWRTTVAKYNPNADSEMEKQGNRVDPTPLFNLP